MKIFLLYTLVVWASLAVPSVMDSFNAPRWACKLASPLTAIAMLAVLGLL